MKTRFFIALASCLLFASCMHTYRFCQIFETQPVDNNIRTNEKGLLQYEDNNCVIIYNFWSYQGSTCFEFYNKTDEIVYIDMTKSFFNRNGMAYNLYNSREWSETATQSTGYYSLLMYQRFISLSSTTIEMVRPGIMTPQIIGGDVVSESISDGKGTSYSSTKATSSSSSYSYTLTVKEEPVVAVPPHKSKYIVTYPIATKLYRSCNLPHYPSTSSSVSFSFDNSPLRFSNYITYSVGNSDKANTVENVFYVSVVSNYPEPNIIEYKERTEPCENLKDEPAFAEKTDRGRRLYDKYTKKDVCDFAGSFYFFYETKSNKQLYKNSNNVRFEYVPDYDAYIMIYSYK